LRRLTAPRWGRPALPGGAAARGRTLPEAIAGVRGRLRRGRTDFDGKLDSLGWDDHRAESLYTTRFLLRGEPAFYAVDDSFPAITAAGLARILRRPELVRAVDYRIDVTALEPARPPACFARSADEED